MRCLSGWMQVSWKVEESFLDGPGKVIGNVIGAGLGLKKERASGWTWIHTEDSHRSKVKGKVVTNTVPETSRWSEKGSEPANVGAEVHGTPRSEQHLRNSPWKLTTAATEVIQQQHENGSCENPAKEISERTIPWKTQ